MVKKELRKLTLAATLTALSVVIDIAFKQVIPGDIQNYFGFPFYAIPLIIGAILLGPIYGGIMAVVADAAAVYFAGFAYLPLFVLSAVAWGTIPWFIVKFDSGWFKLGIAVLVSHVFATGFNTYALSFYGWLHLDTIFWIRIAMIPVNVIIITFMTHQINMRLEPIYMDFKNKTSEI